MILRYGNVFGPRQDAEGEAGVISIFINRLMKSLPPVIYGDGNQTRDFVYVGDVAEANVLAAEGNPGIYNIGSGSEVSINELARLISSFFSSSLEPVYEPPRKGEIYRIFLDVSKAKEFLNWEPRTELLEGLRKTVESFRG